MITNFYPETLIISKKVLEFFMLINPLYGIRSMEFIIHKFQKPSKGRITFDILPEIIDILDWLFADKDEIENLKNWFEKTKNDFKKSPEITDDLNNFVRIYKDPPDMLS
jgi:hypothetical protein